jgi:hypothetical protein
LIVVWHARVRVKAVNTAHLESTIYNPPKSQGFGHVATPRNPFAAWRILETFIEDHAIANEWSATGLSVCQSQVLDAKCAAGFDLSRSVSLAS